MISPISDPSIHSTYMYTYTYNIIQVCAVRGYPLHIQPATATEAAAPIARIAPVARATMDLGFTSPLNIAMVRLAFSVEIVGQYMMMAIPLVLFEFYQSYARTGPGQAAGAGPPGLSVHADGGGAAGDLQRLILLLKFDDRSIQLGIGLRRTNKNAHKGKKLREVKRIRVGVRFCLGRDRGMGRMGQAKGWHVRKGVSSKEGRKQNC